MSELVGKGSKERWYPCSMFRIRAHFNCYEINGSLCPEASHIISNIGYNLQYIEYLKKTLKELNLSEVLQIQTFKSLIVIGASVVEAICFLIYTNEGLGNDDNWIEFQTIGKSNFNLEGETFKSETKIYKKVNHPIPSNTSFKTLIRKIEKKKILDQETQFFKDVNHLRRLRNKIHLQDTSIGSTDYHSFWTEEYQLVMKILKLILNDPIFKNSPNAERVSQL